LFPNTNNLNKSSNPDVYLANYVARRTKGIGGIYLGVKSSFNNAQAVAKADSDYNKNRDEAIEAILLNWEKVIWQQLLTILTMFTQNSVSCYNQVV